ncbi:type 4a pilus biogenesis protein PilO [Methylomonas sp. MgM2]
MNLSEINWDLNAAGSWPTPIKFAAGVIVSLLVVIADVYYITIPQLDELEALENEEINLKTSFETKQKKAVNLQDYRDQLTQIEASLGEMLKQMPTKAEVANLLVDISQTGLASGLEFKLFQPGAPIPKEFYSELPINIQVIGKYEELGLFVSGLASLPRIVTVHDVNIVPIGGNDKTGTMNMSAVIKTYNEADMGASAKSKPRRGGR